MEQNSEPGEVAELVSFVKARLQDDEAFMRAAIRLRDSGAVTSSPEATEGTFSLMDIVMGDPDATNAISLFTRTGTRAPGEPERVLAEVEAKRLLLEQAATSRHLVTGDPYMDCPRVTKADGVGSDTVEHIQALNDNYRQEFNRELGCSESCGRDARVHRTLVLLALPYADHPDYQEGWRP